MAHQQSLMQKKLREQKKTKQEIEQQVEEEYLRPSQLESKYSKELLAEISKKFRNEINQSGFSQETIDKISMFVDRKVSDLNVSFETQKRIARLVVSNITGLGPIQQFMDDKEVTEIVVQRYDNICIERKGKIEKVDTSFMDENHLQTIINRIVQPIGRQINLHNPMVDARLADGSRVNATIPPTTPDGATLTIRKFSDVALTGEDYIRLGSLNRPMLDFLAACVKGKISLIVSGGTNTGKTTLLNMLSSYIPEDELIITIEDSLELKLHQSNVRRMETRTVTSENMMPVTIQSLVKNSLRMRPDRIIVGEIRDQTVVDMMSAMSTGHEGSMSTIHANDPENLVNSRLPILYSMYPNMNFSIESQAIQIAEALHLIIQIQHTIDGKRRISQITHIAGAKNGRVDLKDIFYYDDDDHAFYSTGYIPENIIKNLKKREINFDLNILVNNTKEKLKDISR